MKKQTKGLLLLICENENDFFKMTFSPTSYIFAYNKLNHSLFSAVYKKFLPTFLGAFWVFLSNFKN